MWIGRLLDAYAGYKHALLQDEIAAEAPVTRHAASTAHPHSLSSYCELLQVKAKHAPQHKAAPAEMMRQLIKAHNPRCAAPPPWLLLLVVLI